jgi:purine-binding chemotaxis protein CheW
MTEKHQTGNRVLVFHLGSEEYAIEVSRIREVIAFSESTRLPSVPQDVLGVINLRGQVITVVDARSRLRMAKQVPTGETVLLILDVNEIQIGLQVDAVSGVITFGDAELSETPKMDGQVASYVKQVIRRDKRLVLELCPEKLLGHLAINKKAA